MTKRNFTIRLSEEDLEWLKEEAERQQRTVANLITYILSLYHKGNTTRQGEFPTSSRQETL